MNMPFYVSPEQMMKDRADYARKGIARGRSLVALQCAAGVVIVAENPSRTLYKISEIYDRIAFAGVGKYNEFQSLKIGGVRLADLKGYQYSPEDVNAGGLANAYAQTLGQVFTHEMKPYEVEILVASVGATDDEPDQLFHILYDGTVMDEQRFTVLGGEAERIAEALGSRLRGRRVVRRRGEARRQGRWPATASRSPRASSRSRCSTGRARRARSGASRATSSTTCSPERGASAARARCADRRERGHHDRDAAPAPPPRDGGPTAGCVRLGERGRVLDLVGEQHVRRVVDLVLGDVDLDPGHLTDGEPVGRVDRAPQAGVDALVGEAGEQHPGRERAVHLGEAHHRHRTLGVAHVAKARTACPVACPRTPSPWEHAWNAGSSDSRTSTASPAPSAASAG